MLEPYSSYFFWVRLILRDAILRPEVFVEDENFACLGANREWVMADCYCRDCVVPAFIITDLE